MDISRKLELGKQHIRSISTHDDADMAIRVAALDQLVECIEGELQGMKDRVQKRIDALKPEKKSK